MGKIYRDDVNGEEYSNDVLNQFGIVTWDGLMADFDVHEDTIYNQPDAIADELHDMVDDWLETTKEYIENEADYLTECHHCEYRWEYTGDRDRATCPNCGNKTPIKAGLNGNDK